MVMCKNVKRMAKVLTEDKGYKNDFEAT